MEITSINNKLVKDITKLHKRKYRNETNQFIVEGYHLYEEAKKAGNIKYVFTTDRYIIGPNVHYVTDQVLEKLTQTKNPQAVLTVCEKITSKNVYDKVLLLDHIQDPGNLGTLMRSALAFGFDTIVLDNTVDIYNDKVLRSTQGAIFKLSIIESNAMEFMNEHPSHTVYGTSMSGQALKELNFPEKVILILGNEGAGVKKELLGRAHHNITIKTKDVDSLNVGVAGSIIMCQISNL